MTAVQETSHPATTEVETSSGRVRGRREDGVSAFLGIPYGASTAGANRFRPPAPVAPWTGVRDATGYGHIAPQPYPAGRIDYVRLIDWWNQPGGQDEDCLVVNVWTPATDGGRRPVLVSLHGGGFSTGSGNHAGFDGAELVRFGDVVVVTVNHRLGVLGHLHLADLPGAPEEWATSGTAGMQDCVAALRWVHDNIAAFGGDPDRVMVFGQSGGGAKTCALLAMPSAVGLVHRAGIQSGSAVLLSPRENATRNATKLLDHLGLGPSRIAELRDVPVPMLVAAQAALESRGATPLVFAPVVDGDVLPQHPFAPAAPEISRDVPIINSTTLDEATAMATDVDLDEAGLSTQITALAGESATPRVLDAYRKAYPDLSPFRLMARIRTDRGQFRSANTLAERKAAQGGAPVYRYLFTWPSPAFGGRFAAVHGVDVSLVFHRYESVMHGGEPRAQAIATELASAWVNFARTGDPNGAGVPSWPAYTADRRSTLVIGDATDVVDNPLADLRQLWDDLAT